MGLDMYLYRLEKPRPAVSILNKQSIDTLRDLNYFVVPRDGCEIPANIESILPFAKEINIDVRYINFDKIHEEFDIPKGAEIRKQYWLSNEISYTFCLPDKTSKTITIPRETFEAEYLIPRKTDAYCWKEEEVGYWREDYKLQDAMHEACDIHIENCGYYPLSEAMWEVLKEYDPETYEKVKDYRHSRSSVICYHEWY